MDWSRFLQTSIEVSTKSTHPSSLCPTTPTGKVLELQINTFPGGGPPVLPSLFVSAAIDKHWVKETKKKP